MESIDMADVINMVAIVLSPIIAVCIGQWLQKKAEKRKDKMDLFKTLMRSRALSWTIDSVNALNVIDIVFADDKKVRGAWKELYNCLCVSTVGDAEARRILNAKYKLLEEMARSLNYKTKINWETIQNPYLPTGLENQMAMNQDNMQMYNDSLKMMSAILKNSTKNTTSENNIG